MRDSMIRMTSKSSGSSLFFVSFPASISEMSHGFLLPSARAKVLMNLYNVMRASL